MLGVIVLACGCGLVGAVLPDQGDGAPHAGSSGAATSNISAPATAVALGAIVGTVAQRLGALAIAPLGAAGGYSRQRFGQRWKDIDRNGCDQRNDVLHRDLTDVRVKPGTHDCVVQTGTLHDPYSGTVVQFAKGNAAAVQIDHMVPLGRAWRQGAAAWTPADRERFANDVDRPQLLAVIGEQNQSKGDSGPDRWMPPNAAYACTYATRWIDVKTAWKLTATDAEVTALAAALVTCGATSATAAAATRPPITAGALGTASAPPTAADDDGGLHRAGTFCPGPAQAQDPSGPRLACTEQDGGGGHRLEYA